MSTPPALDRLSLSTVPIEQFFDGTPLGNATAFVSAPRGLFPDYKLACGTGNASRD